MRLLLVFGGMYQFVLVIWVPECYYGTNYQSQGMDTLHFTHVSYWVTYFQQLTCSGRNKQSKFQQQLWV